ncbi:MAG: tetratricopeptide repeat protein [Burkholderiaceae bacterium]|nr:tetratricopeptide repeat protein [Burkholderiaceae bacterium]
MRPLLLTLVLFAAPALAAPGIEEAVAAYEIGHLPKARSAFTRLSRAGVPAADYNLAVMHLRGDLPQANPREALRLMTRAAKAGFVTALYGLGQLHELGQGGLSVNLVEAQRWYLRAAQAGSVDGQVAVATAHYLGRGAPKDAALAARWYRIAAQGGDIGAMYLYASMAESGDGVERDLKEARYWYGVAARNGDEAAPSKLIELDAKLGAPKT